MPKKTALAKKSPAAPEQWIRQGDKPATASNNSPIVRATFEFPQDLHRKMKAKAGAEGLTLKEVLMSLARQWVEGAINPQ